MSLVRNWMAMLNAGHLLTPVGSSDSHDVARHFVGQGRTYIRCDDADVSAIPVDRAVDQFLRGAVTVSCGLIADLRINADYGPGDIVPAASQYQIEVDAKGAEWVTASTVEIYVNGRLHSRHTIPRESMTRAGLKHTVSMELDGLPDNDVFVSAVVRGPGVKELFWPIARPYQSRSPDWTPECMAVTGAVWLDLDGDGQRSCAAEYARTVCADISDTERIFSVLQKYDYAVALHAAEILRERDPGVFQETFLIPARRQEAHIAEAFTDYRYAWRDSQLARSAQ